MGRKQVNEITAVQNGFGFPAVDATGKPVPWAKFDKKQVAEIVAASFKGVDLETTGLVPSSARVNLTAQDIKSGCDARLRVRVCTLSYPHNGAMQKVAYDMDQLTPEEQEAVASAALTNVFIAHNAGFDLGWLAELTPTRPKIVIDTMLVSRLLDPDQPIRLAQMAGEYYPDAPNPDPVLRAAWESVMAKASGWALADLILVHFGHIMPKELQGPGNWVPEVLSEPHFMYATDDVDWMLKLLAKLLGADSPVNILERYMVVREEIPMVKRREYLVPDLVEVRLNGIPADREQARTFAAEEYSKAAAYALDMARLAPSLSAFTTNFADPAQGLSDKAKKALAQAFKDLGVPVRHTDKTGSAQVGEKDLRLAGAMLIPAAAQLFDAWVGVARSKKRAQMALDWADFARRSKDGRLHPLLGPVTSTDRLSSAEPNSQQAPRDQGFRAIIRGRPGMKILAVDYSALDMRHGAALAVRAQLEILEAYAGKRDCNPRLLAAIRYVLDTPAEKSKPALQQRLAEQDAELCQLEQARRDGKTVKNFWAKKQSLEDYILLLKFSLMLQEVVGRAKAAGTETWSALRNAFRLGVDIHTYTGMDMAGHDPLKEFEGLSGAELEASQKKWKKILSSGPRDYRQNGKIANLSLLYAMKELGLQTAAGKNYNVHWTLEEAKGIIDAWLNAYPEVALWHFWTDLNSVGTVWAPDPEKGGKRRPFKVYHTTTLAGRPMHVRGLNSALAYPDQGSGADLLERVLHVLRVKYPDVFACVVNQVHDELVLEVPEAVADKYKDLVSRVMDEEANRWLGPYGVVSANSPAMGDVWLKD